MTSRKNIPPQLVQLIQNSVRALGEVLKEELGASGYNRIEALRRESKGLSQKSTQAWSKALDKVASWSSKQRLEAAHAFGLMLELINCCEAAYRSLRLTEKSSPEITGKMPEEIRWVLTAHPTEARTPAALKVFRELQALLTEQLKKPDPFALDPVYELRLKSHLRLLWQSTLSKQHQPSVADEAEHIYSVVFQPMVFSELLNLQLQGVPIYLSTWVGGDKDGHSGVNEVTLSQSWKLSRRYIVNYCLSELGQIEDILKPVAEFSFNSQKLKALLSRLVRLQKSVKSLRVMKVGDGERVESFKNSIFEFRKVCWTEQRLSFVQLERLETLFKLFPAMVVPLELREEASLVKEAIRKDHLPIAKMIEKLAKVSKGLDPRDYARALVLSQTNTYDDLLAGWDLVKNYFPKQNLPVVPLLESEVALRAGPEWIKRLGKDRPKLKIIRSHFNSQFEVMLGYSDSAKENGSLASRFLIFESLEKLERELKKLKLTPIFFHGSGGSVSRGGGPIKDQMSWWTVSAARNFKATLQGEMIQRSFSSPEILRSQVLQIAQQASVIKTSRMPKAEREVLDKMRSFSERSYRDMVADPNFLKSVEVASPYSFLHHLKIGSRPNKRKGALSVNALRAIPWVLCWTQMRMVFQVWWGVGSAWQALKASERSLLKRAFKSNAVLSSYIHLLGFSLAKVELRVFEAYLKSSSLDESLKKQIFLSFSKEYELTVKAFREIAGQKNFLWLRPWLGESIAWRSPMIHPLNLLQIVALKKKEPQLLRESVTGIASGMMTTG